MNCLGYRQIITKEATGYIIKALGFAGLELSVLFKIANKNITLIIKLFSLQIFIYVYKS